MVSRGAKRRNKAEKKHDSDSEDEQPDQDVTESTGPEETTPAPAPASTTPPPVETVAATLAPPPPDEVGPVEIVVHFPKSITYCPTCSFPAEFCEFSGMFDKCKPWLMENAAAEEARNIAEAEERGRKRRIPGEAAAAAKTKGRDQLVTLTVKSRARHKFTTLVTGMELFGHNLQKVSTEFKKMFSCGAGVLTDQPGKPDQIEVQGDVVERLCDLLVSKWNIPSECVAIVEEKQKKEKQ